MNNLGFVMLFSGELATGLIIKTMGMLRMMNPGTRLVILFVCGICVLIYVVLLCFRYFSFFNS